MCKQHYSEAHIDEEIVFSAHVTECVRYILNFTSGDWLVVVSYDKTQDNKAPNEIR